MLHSITCSLPLPIRIKGHRVVLIHYRIHVPPLVRYVVWEAALLYRKRHDKFAWPRKRRNRRSLSECFLDPAHFELVSNDAHQEANHVEILKLQSGGDVEA